MQTGAASHKFFEHLTRGQRALFFATDGQDDDDWASCLAAFQFPGRSEHTFEELPALRRGRADAGARESGNPRFGIGGVVEDSGPGS